MTRPVTPGQIETMPDRQGRAPHEDSPLVARGVVCGAALHASSAGLLVESGATLQRLRVPEESQKSLLACLDASGGLQREEPAVPAAVRSALEQAGALAPAPETIFVDLAGLVEGASPVIAELESRPGRVMLIGALWDARLGEQLAACERATKQALVVWLTAGSAVVVSDDGLRSPCARCALLLDAAAPHQVALAEAAPGASAWSQSLRCLVTGLVRALTSPGATWPKPGEALVVDAASCLVTRHLFSRHPGCVCARRETSACATPVPLDWEELSARRFPPVVPLSRGTEDHPARVIYRGNRTPWPLRRSSFGVALAHGEQAPERALAEAAERVAMMHAAPALRGVAAHELAAPRLPDVAIARLLFLPEAYDQPGFRFRPYDTRATLDWSWAECLPTGERRLVPTGLVGSEHSAQPRLVDATSNGYACHPARDLAVLHGLLEVIERDAVLLGWYAGKAMPRVEGLGSEGPGERVHALLATQDIDVPVVLLVAELDDGALRCAAGAGVSWEQAIAAAQRELRSTLAVPRTAWRPPVRPLDNPVLASGPTDHAAWYDQPGRSSLLRDWLHAGPSVSAESLRQRWPLSDTPPLAIMNEALDAKGLQAWVVDRNLPDSITGASIVRVLVPGAVELSWGQAYRRTASPRACAALLGRTGLPWPHPIA